jgi:hypothetical protein
VTVILAGAGNFSRCLRAADDLAIELSRWDSPAQSGAAFSIQASGPHFDPQCRAEFKGKA